MASTIVRTVGLQRAATTVLDRVERAGYARRVRDPNDRRGVLIEMTDKANKAVGEIWSLVVKAGEQMLAMASEADLRVILAFLEGARALQLSHLARRRTSGGGDKHQEKIDRRADPGHDQKPV